MMADHRHYHNLVLDSVLRKINQTWPALVVLGLGLLISLVSWHLTGQRADAEAAREFQQVASRAVELVACRTTSICCSG
jgi:CHASE1-domain containing sensor protein